MCRQFEEDMSTGNYADSFSCLFLPLSWSLLWLNEL